MTVKHLNRWHAFGYHMLFSLALLVFCLTILLTWWYPGRLIDFGGWQGIRLVTGVDLILGPLLTLVVYNPSKPNLKTDLSVILAIQLSCLCAGMYVVHSQQPVIFVLSDEGIHTVTYSETRMANIEASQLPPTIETQRIRWFVMALPEDRTKSNIHKVQIEITKGINFYLDSSLYRPVFDTDELTLRTLKHFEYNDNENCHELVMHSYYINKKICLNSTDFTYDLTSM